MSRIPSGPRAPFTWPPSATPAAAGNARLAAAMAVARAVTGQLDIRAADVRHFERVVERISAEPFVVRTRSVIVLSRLVSRASFPPPGPDGSGGASGAH